MKKALKILLGVTAFLIILSLFIGGSDDKKDENQPKDEPVAAEEKIQLPEISEQGIENAYNAITAHDGVRDAHIEVNKEDETISMAIQVGASMNEETAKELADSFVRALSSGVSFYSEGMELDGPTADDLGEIYDYYNLIIVVGSSPEDTIIDGAKVKAAKKITW